MYNPVMMYGVGPEAISRIVDELDRVKKGGPFAVLKINRQVRRMLQSIQLRCKLLRIVYKTTDPLELPVARGHEEFDTLHSDAGMISLALEKTRLPKQFINPVCGGIDFLRHVKVCPFCLYLVGRDDEQDEETREREDIGIRLLVEVERYRRRRIN